MQVQRVRRARWHDVHPKIRESNGAAAEVHFEGARKAADVLRELPFELGKRAGKAMQLVHRGVAGVSAGVILLRPTAPRRIEIPQSPALVRELRVEPGQSGFLERLGID